MQLEEVLAASMLDCVSSQSELATSTTADTATATTVRTSQSSSNSNDNQASSSSRLDKSLPQSERIDDKSKDADFAQSLLESEVAAFSLDRELALKLAREDGQVVDLTSLETSLAGSDPKGSDPKVDKKVSNVVARDGAQIKDVARRRRGRSSSDFERRKKEMIQEDNHISTLNPEEASVERVQSELLLFLSLTFFTLLLPRPPFNLSLLYFLRCSDSVVHPSCKLNHVGDKGKSQRHFLLNSSLDKSLDRELF